MKKFSKLSEPMKIAFIGAIATIVAAVIGAIISGIFLIRSISPQAPTTPSPVVNVASTTQTISATPSPTITAMSTPTETLPLVPALAQKNFESQLTTSITAAFPSSVITGNLIIVAISQFRGSVSTVMDNRGDHYTQVTAAQHANSTTDFAELYYAKNVKGGTTTVTVTFSIFGDKNVGIYEFSGIDSTSPLDQIVTQAGFGNSPNGGTLNTTKDNELYFVLGVDDDGANSAPSGGNGYLLEDHQDDSTMHERFYSEYRIYSHGSYQTNFSIAANSQWVVIGASFNPVGTSTT